MKTKLFLAASAFSTLLVLSATAQVTVTTVTTNNLNEPYNVVVDDDNNLYISDGANNRIVKIDSSSQAQSTLAGIAEDAPGSNDGPAYLAHFNNPQGLLLATVGTDSGLLVTDYGNSLVRFVRLSDGFVSTVAGQVPGTLLYPLGLDKDAGGHVYIADFGHNAIQVLNLSDLSITTLAISGTTLYRPSAVAFVSPNQLWVADTGNQMVKLLTLTSPTSATLYTVLGGYRSVGSTDSSFGPNARFNGPSGLLWLQGIGLLISDELNNSVRLATNYTAFGATNYSVTTFAGIPTQPGLVDGGALSAKLNSPVGLAVDPQNNGFVLADLKNNAIRRIQTGPALPPVPSPQLGWVLFVKDSFGDYVSQLQVGQSFIFNNDVIIAILGTDGTETHFTFGPTPPNPLNDTIPNPTKTVGSTPGVYRNGVHAEDVPPSIISAQPDVTVKAIGFEAGRQSSPIVSARFQFKVAAPFLQGNNAALFTVTDQTIGAVLWYTTDGTDPTNSAPSLSIPGSANGVGLSLNVATNFTFKIRGFRDGFQPSEIVSQDFSATNFNANKISFGFNAGEASSDFIGSPGQFFYAPVTLTVLPAALMYSLQFNVTVATNPGTIHLVEPGAVSFSSALVKIPKPEEGLDHLPPASLQAYLTIPPAMFVGLTTNALGVTNVPIFGSLLFTNANSSTNLLGIGWLERWGFKELYDTTIHDLISFSSAHDTLFNKQDGRVVVGSYGFKIPLSAVDGDTYRIQINRPSATSDGVGAPGSDVFIDTPTNGSLTSGAINSFKNVTVGVRKYIAGDVYPFRWFNAGDFGNTNLENADVMQVFQSAIYLIDNPPAGSDFFNSMDSCGFLGTNDPSSGLVFPYVAGDPAAMFDGNDQCINYMAFGDGKLDVCDVFVTFRRSLDPNLVLFQRYWRNGSLVAQVVGNPPTNAPAPQGVCPLIPPSALASSASVTFGGTDLQASAGQTLQVPIHAQIVGPYPLKVFGLNLSVKALDGSPEITTPVQFTPNPQLGVPTLTSTRSGTYAAAWLDTARPGLSNNASLGTLSFQVPANAPTNAAYAIHFDHASASPNGLASFPKKTQTALVTLTDRSGSTYNDGIPDSWRLRYFGSVDNVLSQARADADGDGMNNWQEYIAGTDPTDAKSCLRASGSAGAAATHDCVIHWPSVSGKNYVIERSASLFTPSWLPLATNLGTGSDMEYHDATGGSVRFYRVRVQ